MAGVELDDPLRPRPVDDKRSAAVLALLAHGGLIAALALGLNWRASPPTAITAELWAAVPQETAPEGAAPEANAPPEPPPQAPAQEQPTADPESDIALKKARQEPDRRQRQEADREKARLREERLRQEEQQRQKDRQREREKERERQAAEKADRAAEQRAERLRQENLARIKGMAAGSGSSQSTASASQAGAPSAGYAGRIKARIKPLIVYPETLGGNPVAEVEVRLSPTGAILGQRLLRKSDSPEWDAAVTRAVEKAEVLPRDTDGRVPAVIVIQFSRRE